MILLGAKLELILKNKNMIKFFKNYKIKVMKLWNKLVFRVAILFMTPVLIVSLILSTVLYQTYAKRAEHNFKNYLEEIVFNYNNLLDFTLDKVSIAATKDANDISGNTIIDSTELADHILNNLELDTIIFGSGIFFDEYDLPGDTSKLNYIYAYKTYENNSIHYSGNIVAKNKYNYVKQQPEWWKVPKTTFESGWTEPYFDPLSDSTWMITYYKPFFIKEEFSGVVTIDVSIDKLSQWLERHQELSTKGYSITTALLTEKGNIVYSDIKDRIGKNIYDTNSINAYQHDVSEAYNLVSKALNGKWGSYILHSPEGGKKSIAFYSGLQSSKWKQISTLPYEIIQKTINKTLFWILIFIIVFNTFLVVTLIILARYFIVPIKKLSQSSIEIASGNFETNLGISSTTELGILSSNYSLMAKKLKNRESELIDANKKYELIFNAAPVGIIYFDINLEILSHNSIVSTVLGFKPDENIIGYNLNDLTITQEYIEILKEVIEEGKQYITEIESMHVQNRVFQIIIEPILNNEGIVTSILALLNDITEQKRYTNLKIEKEAAIKASEAKSSFLANMSHEIRTPMNAIIGLSYLMSKTTLDLKQENYLKKINSSAKLLLGIINDILDFSKIEAGKLKLDKANFDLEDTLKDINNIFSFTATEKGIEFILYLDPKIPKNIIGDELRLKQILINFISNAIKFTNKGEVILSVNIVKQNKDGSLTLNFSVKDTGIGMSDEQKSKIFGAFAQADASTTRNYGGTGLGLSIAEGLVKLMGGEITLESKMDYGSTFSFSANVEKGELAENEDFKISDDISQTKALVCDNNRSFRTVIGSILKSFTFKVKDFSNATSLIKHLEKTKIAYKFIVLDWKLPEMDGIEAARIIKTSKKIKNIPKIILLTTYNEMEVSSIYRKYIDALIYKPVTNSVLYDTIMNVLGKQIPKTSTNTKSGKLLIEESLKRFSGARILLVEDNEINQEVATELIESFGLEVDIAENGKIAYEKLLNDGAENLYNLIFMDLQMPVMDGYTSTIKIRENKKLQHIPIIAMTADVLEGVREKCLSIGMKDFISKPINPNEVMGAIINYSIKPDKPKKSKKNSIAKSDQSYDFDLKQLKHINYKEGIERVNNNTDLYIKILKKFALNYNQVNLAENFLQPLKKQDFETLRRQLHTLKGVSGNIGANRLHEFCKKIEVEFSGQIPSTAFDKLSELAFKTNEVVADINNLFGELNEENNTGGKFQSTPKIIENIKLAINLLENSDPDAIGIIEEINFGEEYKELKNNIFKALNEYNFDAAIESLNNFLTTINE